MVRISRMFVSSRVSSESSQGKTVPKTFVNNNDVNTVYLLAGIRSAALGSPIKRAETLFSRVQIFQVQLQSRLRITPFQYTVDHPLRAV